MMKSPGVNINSLEYDRQITQFARDVSNKLNKRISEIEQSADNLESYCRQVCMQVNGAASRMANLKNQKAVKQVVTDKNVLNESDIKKEPKSIFENHEFLQNYQKAIIDSKKMLPQMENYVIFSKSYEEVGEVCQQNGARRPIVETHYESSEEEEPQPVPVQTPVHVNGKLAENPPPPPPMQIPKETVKQIPKSIFSDSEEEEREKEEIVEEKKSTVPNSQAEFLKQLQAAVASKHSVKSEEKIDEPPITAPVVAPTLAPTVVPTIQPVKTTTDVPTPVATTKPTTAPTIAPPKLPVPKNSLFQDTDSDDDEELFAPKKLVAPVRKVSEVKPASKTPVEVPNGNVEKEIKTQVLPPAPEPKATAPTSAASSNSTSKPLVKKSIFSSDSDSDDDFLRSLSKTNKTATTKEVKKVADPPPQVAVKTTAAPPTVIPANKPEEKKPVVKKSLFDDSDSDSDLFSSAAKVKSAASTKTEDMKKDIKTEGTKVQQKKLNSNIISKLENTLRFNQPPTSAPKPKPEAAINDASPHDPDSDVAAILKSRCRGPSNRRPPTRPHTSN